MSQLKYKQQYLTVLSARGGESVHNEQGKLPGMPGVVHAAFCTCTLTWLHLGVPRQQLGCRHSHSQLGACVRVVNLRRRF